MRRLERGLDGPIISTSHTYHIGSKGFVAAHKPCIANGWAWGGGMTREGAGESASVLIFYTL